MRFSIFSKILLWCLGTAAFTYVGFTAISNFVGSRSVRRGEFFDGVRHMQISDARRHYETGGPKALEVYLTRLRTFLPDQYYFLDARGKDLVTGEDRSALLAEAIPPGTPPKRSAGPVVLSMATSDNLYRWVIVIRRRSEPPSFLPYYLLILAAIVWLCYILAVSLATPLRRLAGKVEQFGQGNLAVRVRSARQDEIGDLTRSFDQMADRIETLLTAERRLLQDISHELRSPLARLSFAVELTRTAEDREAAIAKIKKEVDRLTSLVSALLQVTRAEGDPASRNLEEIAVGGILRELADDCTIEAQARNCELRLDLNGDVRVRGDRELLRRAFENVLRNAIRHSPERAPIDLRLETRAPLAVVSIRDRGPGVPGELLGDIFKPFFRVDSARDNQHGGVGLGLAIAERAISLHQGRLRATNMQPGLMVEIELPLEAGDANHPDTTSPRTEPAVV
jgi:two-component system sensor histidine kinase CpxA